MTLVDTSRWKEVGETSNTRYYAAEDGFVLGLPHPGSVDDEGSARQNVAFQMEYLEGRGGGVVIILFDNLVSQSKAARRVYQSEPDLDVMRATALVGGSMLARAIASFFLGLAKPRIPVKMFGDVDSALQWGREINRQRDAQRVDVG